MMGFLLVFFGETGMWLAKSRAMVLAVAGSGNALTKIADGAYFLVGLGAR
jgi:hypothetical protein